MNSSVPVENLTSREVCKRIGTLTTRMMRFWKESRGWAPEGTFQLLNGSMLEWQASLSTSLSQWLTASSDGDLILAWVHLGALVEGQLKLFLSVYYEDYLADAKMAKRKNKLAGPDGLALERLRQFFVDHIWTVGEDWNWYVHLVQQRRNAIHAFKYRDIGTFHEWKSLIYHHLVFVRDINNGLPYPDEIAIPREI